MQVASCERACEGGPGERDGVLNLAINAHQLLNANREALESGRQGQQVRQWQTGRC